jgi:4-amino-4-deoxy-L-arabinose transferase-like glycosyltransferase
VTSEVATAVEPNARAMRRLLAVGCVLVIGVGLFLRIWALGREPLNSDVAVVGLMAREILHGHFFAFYWGQDYGGGEPYVVAALFALFGQSPFVLGLTPILLDAAAAILVWRIGRRLFSSEVGVAAALLFWIWPEVYIWQSTLEYGFRWLALCCGLVVLLFGLRIGDGADGDRARDWCVLGLAAGVGWWCSPEIIYYVVPVVLVLAGLAVTRRVHLGWRALVGFALSAIVGAFPWIWSNVRSRLDSLHSAPQPDPSFVEHLGVLRHHSLPIAFGVQLPVSGRWLIGTTFGHGVYYFGLFLLLVFLVVLVRRREALMLVLFAVGFPFFYALSPATWFWQDGRYAVYVVPVAALLLVAGLSRLVRTVLARLRRPIRFAALTSVVVVLAGLGLTIGAAVRVAPFRPNNAAGSSEASWTSWSTVPNATLAQVASALERSGTKDVVAGYWVGYTLAFQSDGRLVASDVSFVRYPPYLAIVERPGSAWLFVRPAARRQISALIGSSLVDPGCAVAHTRCLDARQFRAYLTHAHIGETTRIVGDFEAVIPKGRVDVKALSAQYHLRAG